MTFTKPTDKAIINRMAENFLKMKKLRSRYGTLFFMSIVILTVQCIFLIVGGFNVYMLEGIVMNFLVFYFGTKKFDSVTAQYVLMAVNIVAAAAFIIWNPVSDLLPRKQGEPDRCSLPQDGSTDWIWAGFRLRCPPYPSHEEL